MAPTSARTVGTLLPHGGSLDSPSVPFLLSTGMGAVTVTVIALAVPCVLGTIAILVLLLRSPGSKPSPLPSTQPLAYHRKRESKCLPRPYFPHKSIGFDEESLNGNEKASLGPLRMPSFRTIDSSRSGNSTDESVVGSTIHPIPVISPPCPVLVISHSDDHVPTDKGYISTTRLARSSSLSRSASNSRHDLSRKPSTVSSRILSTYSSTGSTSTIRGAPHRPHNNIKIVLPTPLTPQATTKNRSEIHRNKRSPDPGWPISDQWMQTFISSWRSSANGISERGSFLEGLRRLGSEEDLRPAVPFDSYLSTWKTSQFLTIPQQSTPTP
ncbi:hypothetical protein BJ322DRAFT_766821 [Thelephora terrestris]|uniref:Uncharacterized protein n=1 Tax=Thelephora terrestris TaxID=56493 RepID=A0A9P6HG39_9AGAM|nr:hypothetical protein BJ322DRAFT_766821 [Thelephora terrestris]